MGQKSILDLISNKNDRNPQKWNLVYLTTYKMGEPKMKLVHCLGKFELYEKGRVSNCQASNATRGETILFLLQEMDNSCLSLLASNLFQFRVAFQNSLFLN
uniref:Uncharacterized protein n=1 Tax=Micrurus corallinus TaxID=54390 RepID=A0A2D4GS24_MICCO